MNSRMTFARFGALVVAIVGLLVIALPGTAAARDRNHDRIPDRWEKRHHLSLHKNQAKRDQDRDALVNRREWKAGMDPRDSDSDNDGVEDGDEGAGTISSFDEGVLTINLFNGGSISGLVTDDTEIDCDSGDDHGDEDGDHNDDGGDVDDGDVDDVDDGVDGEVDESAAASEDDLGDDEGDEGDDDTEGDDDQHECSVDDLTVDTVVQEADLVLVHGDAVFEEIELIK